MSRIFSKIASFIQVAIIIGIVGLIIYTLIHVHFGEGALRHELSYLHYEIDMLENGDALVTEKRTYDFKRGYFSRIFLDLDRNVEDIKVFENDKAFTYIPNFDNERPENKYSYSKRFDSVYLEFYIDAQKEKRTFEISYRVKQAFTQYEDCVLYVQKFLSEKNSIRIGKLTANINLLDGLDKSNTMIWGHGPAQGEIEFDNENDSKVKLLVRSVPANEYVEALFLIDEGILNNIQYNRDFKIRQRVIEEEQAAAKQADRQNLVLSLVTIFLILLFCALILWLIMLRIKFKSNFKRNETSFKVDYYRDIPENIPPALLDKLYNYYKKGSSTPRSISATILDMIQRKVILVSYKGEGKKKQAILTKARHELDDKHITKFEKPIIQFLFEDVANGQSSVSMDMVKKYCKSRKNISDIKRMIFSFTQKIDEMWKDYDYVEKTKNNVPKAFRNIKIVNVLLIVINFFLLTGIAPDYLRGILGLSFFGFVFVFILSIFLSRKKQMLNKRGEDKLSLWHGFIKFLNDFTLFEEKDLPELFMWDKYLVYASVLGVSKKVLAKLKIKYTQLNDEDYIRNNMMLYYSLYQIDNNFSNSFESIDNSIQSAISDAQTAISHTFSGGSGASTGSGGGFSSGGDFGGTGAGGSTGGGAD